MKSRILRHAGALAALLAVSGCSSLSYYAQSLDGHLELMAARQNVERLIEKPSTPEPLRNRMAAAHEIRQFAPKDRSAYLFYNPGNRVEIQ